MIYACMVIPLIAVIFLSWKFPKRMTILERVLVFAIPAIAIIIAKFVSVATMTSDTEYWNSYATKVVYYEPWSTWVTKTCTREVCSGSGENRKCRTKTYDCSECEHHSARWVVYDNTGKTFSTNGSHFNQLCKRWNNRSFKDMHRSISHGGFGCGEDGDAYVTEYPGDFDLTQPICKQHRYENKVQCSKSVFNYEPVDSETIEYFGLYRYPHYESMGIYNYNPLIGAKDSKAAQKLSYHNAHLGVLKQVHMMLVVFHDKSIEAAEWQEAHWGNGNKNEFILCLGEKDGKVDWAQVISWTEKEDLKVRVARKAKEIGWDHMDLVAIVDMMAEEVRSGYVRKEFADFSYIKVEPTPMAVFWTFLITVVITVGISLFSVLNGYDRGSGYRRYR